MREAIRLARLGRWVAHPNPAVGAVVVKEGRIVGRGFHRGPGTPHAEREALAQAGEAARGADLYVTLEPCVHTGRTPPCTDAVVAAGVRQVFVGTLDPDEKVSGRGVELLRQRGVEVKVGVAREEAEAVDLEYFHHRSTGRPFVRYKVAATLDGFVAAADGTSRWITSEEARKDAHLYRARADAIAVGAGTVAADDPALTCRFEEFSGPQPARVVFDTVGRLTGAEKVFSNPGDEVGGRVIVFTGPGGAKSLIGEVQQASKNVEAVSANDLGCWDVSSLPEVAVVETKLAGKHVDIGSALRFLGSIQVVEVLLEGGPTLAASFAGGGYIDEIVVYVGAKLLGGGGVPILEGERGRLIAEAEEWQILEVSNVSGDAKIVARPVRQARASPAL